MGFVFIITFTITFYLIAKYLLKKYKGIDITSRIFREEDNLYEEFVGYIVAIIGVTLAVSIVLIASQGLDSFLEGLT